MERLALKSFGRGQESRKEELEGEKLAPSGGVDTAAEASKL